MTDLNTYFSEYVLEQSNATNYFNVYVAGFTLAPTSNMTNSSGPGNKKPEAPTETTIWYSNEVSMPTSD